MRRFWFIFSIAWLTGCSSTPHASLFSTQGEPTANDYHAVLERWTRNDRIYRGFDSQLFVTATLHTAQLRQAFASAFPEIYGHGGMVTRRELVDLTDNVEQFHNFFVAVYTPDAKMNDFDQPDSIWRLRLTGSSQVVVDPAEIQMVKIDANLRQVYPYLSRFDKAYIVRFPLVDSTQHLVIDPQSTSATLRIASALGAAELHWQLDPASGNPHK